MTENITVIFVYPHSDPLDPAGSGGQNRLYNFIIKMVDRYNVSVIGQKFGNDVPKNIETIVYDGKTPGFVSDLDYSLAGHLYKSIRTQSPDIIHIPYPSGIVLSKLLSILIRSDTSVVLDAHDVMTERAKQFDNRNLGAITKHSRKIYIPTLESIATRVADHVITVSEKDAKLMEQLNGIHRNKITVIPNGADPVDQTELTPRESVRDELGLGPDTVGLVFHGNYETGTHNLEAAERIIDVIAPQFSDRTDVQFFIIGKGTPETDLENVTTLGFVDDLYSTLNAMDLAVVPLTSGTATKLKMFDYMSVGLPIVSTEKGTEGIELEHNKHVLCSDTDTEQFVSSIERLLEDDALRDRLRRNARRLIKEKYNWDTIGGRLNDVYENLIDR
ncbi:glycosyltransferase [Halohasta salina]|uniref:glycosyltransferase n=1 Tax=Halohasta salina TaxID=2961621 RepID=UPI0020A4DE8D|nr:glycosyltransferase [Halohasta salina]